MHNGDAFLICSDGFWEYVYETEMEADLLKSDSTEVWLKYMLKRHILRAENKGDNYTAICGIIHFEDGEVPVTSKAVRISGSASDVPRKKSLPLPLIIAGAVIIAAAAFLAFFLGRGGKGGISDSTQNPYSTSEVSGTAETSELPSESESSEITSEQPTVETPSEG